MQEIKMNTPFFWNWATVAVLGNVSIAPQFWSLVSSTASSWMGEWIQMGMEQAQHTLWECRGKIWE